MEMLHGPCLTSPIWSILIKVKESCEHLPPIPNLQPDSKWNPNEVWEKDLFSFSGFDAGPPRTLAEMSYNGYWCLPCGEVWLEKVKDNINKLGDRKEAFDKAGDPWKKIKMFSSCEDLKQHIKAVHIFSTQKYRMVCPMQGCAFTNVDVKHHMKVFHGVDEEEAWYCQEADLKNGICGCRIHGNSECAEDILPCITRHRIQAHGLSTELFDRVERLYEELDRKINPWE